jgi:hypothetical protein
MNRRYLYTIPSRKSSCFPANKSCTRALAAFVHVARCPREMMINFQASEFLIETFLS